MAICCYAAYNCLCTIKVPPPTHTRTIKSIPPPLSWAPPLQKVEEVAIRKFGSLEAVEAERWRRTEARLSGRLVSRRRQQDSQLDGNTAGQTRVRQRLQEEYGGRGIVGSSGGSGGDGGGFSGGSSRWSFGCECVRSR